MSIAIATRGVNMFVKQFAPETGAGSSPVADVGNDIAALRSNVTALATALSASEVLVFGSALVALALNRLILAALGASLPRTVPADLLVTGNAVAPTVGTVVTVIGAGIGLSLRGLLDAIGDAAPFVAAACGYAVTSLLVSAFRSVDLGPDRPKAQSVWAVALGDVRSGAAHLSHTGAARRALALTTLQRVIFGALTAWTIVVIRFLFEGTRADEEHALAALGSVALSVGVGLLLASIAAPTLVRHLGTRGSSVIASEPSPYASSTSRRTAGSGV